MRYIVIGAGAVGGTIGARLFESGHEVVLVARGAHVAALREHGLRFLTPLGSTVLPVPAVDRPAALDLRADDVLVLAVKTQDTVAALDAWAGRPVAGAGGATAGEALPVVCAQNAVENERLALRRFRRVYGMCVWLPGTHLEPGVVAASGVPLSGILHLGRYPDGLDETAMAIAADLAASGFGAPVSERVMSWKYGKLLGNLGNALEALVGRVEGPDALELARRVRVEGVAALTAAGIEYVTEEEQAAARGTQVEITAIEGVDRDGGSSWQSLARATGSIEADYLNGEIVLLGRRYGLPTPVNELLQREANRSARSGLRPGAHSAAALLARLAS